MNLKYTLAVALVVIMANLARASDEAHIKFKQSRTVNFKRTEVTAMYYPVGFPIPFKPTSDKRLPFSLRHGPVVPYTGRDPSFEDVIARETMHSLGTAIDLHKMHLHGMFFDLTNLLDPAEDSFGIDFPAEVDAPDFSSVPAEPTAATDGQTTIVTGNGYASIKKANGTFLPVNVNSTFQVDSGATFCDQTVTYIPSAHTFVWVMLWRANGTFVKVGLSTSCRITQDDWTMLDLGPGQLGNFDLDFPSVAFSGQDVYVTIDREETTPVVARIPLNYAPTPGLQPSRIWSPPDDDITYVRICTNSGPTVYIGAHEDDSTLRVYPWAELDNDPGAPHDMPVPSFSAPFVLGSPAWLNRAKNCEFTGASMLPGHAFFAWSAINTSVQSNPQMIHPLCAVADVDVINWATSMRYVWSKDWAIAYPAVSTQQGTSEIGISYVLAVGTSSPYRLTHAVGLLKAPIQYAPVYQSDPYSNPGWGDYFGLEPLASDASAFQAILFRYAPGKPGMQLTCFKRAP